MLNQGMSIPRCDTGHATKLSDAPMKSGLYGGMAKKCVGYAKHCVGDLCPLGMISFNVSATSPCNRFIRNSRAFACVLWQCKETVFERLSTHSSACVCTLILYLKLQNAGITSCKSKSNMSISCELTHMSMARSAHPTNQQMLAESSRVGVSEAGEGQLTLTRCARAPPAPPLLGWPATMAMAAMALLNPAESG